MADFRLSREAQRDLENISAFGITHFGGDVAARHLEGLDHIFERLAAHPAAGRKRPELGVGLRSIPHRPHVVLYRVTGDEVLIVRVIHGARDIRGALSEE